MAIHGRNRDKIIEAIRSRTDFTVASMSGTRIGARYPVQLGIARGDVTFVVYSYGTPIGWIENGKCYIPAINYSPTTASHQTITRVALNA